MAKVKSTKISKLDYKSKRNPRKMGKKNLKLKSKSKAFSKKVHNVREETFLKDESDVSDREIEGNFEKYDGEHDSVLSESFSNDENCAENSEYGSENEDEDIKHKKDLLRLKESDPDFYKFLEENDKKLLEFKLSDNEDDTDGIEDIHKPSEHLEVASDESDYEDNAPGEVKDEKVITLKLLKKWQTQIQTDKSNQTILALTQAFHAALCRISFQEDENEPTQYKVEGPSVFNGVVQVCVLELGPAIRRYLGLQKGSKQPPHKCKKFSKIKQILKSYFADILKKPKSVNIKYNDDSSFIVSAKNDEIEVACNAGLGTLLSWFSNNSMYLNSSKTTYMRSHTPQYHQDLDISLIVGSEAIHRSDTTKFLGLILDENVNWIQVALWHMFLGNSPASGQLFVTQKRVIRCILGIKQHESCRTKFKELGILILA